MEENNDFVPQVFDNPQDLAAAMQSETQSEPVETQQEPVETQPEAQPEPTPQEDGFDAPVETPQPEPQEESRFDAMVEDRGNQQPEYSQEDIDSNILRYVSEKLGREINSFDDFRTPQINESVDAINRFVQETGRTPQDWFRYQTLNPEGMDDMTAIKVSVAADYPDLTPQEIDILVRDNYKIDAEKHGEETARVAALRMKIDAQQARNSIQEIRNKYATPVQNDYSDEPLFDQQWMDNMANEFNSVEGLEFDLGDGNSLKFGLNDTYKRTMIENGARLDEFFDPFFREDGSFDYDSLATQMAVVDNIDTIVRAAYNKGRGDGQRGLVSKAANVGTQQPKDGDYNSNPLGEQVKNIMSRQSNTLTFNI